MIEAEKTRFTPDDLKRLGAKWIDRIMAAEKREADWIKDAEAAEDIYLCDDKDSGEQTFNILHSNVETIVPSIYNSTPVPDIRPRHGAKDDTGKSVADVLERAISAQIDDSRLDAEIEASALDVFMAGRGIVRIKFDADVQDIPAQVGIDQITGEEVEIAPAQQVVTNERVVFEAVAWRDYRQGPAKRLDALPWVAYRHCVSEDELERLTDDEYREDFDPEAQDQELDQDIWEIWDRETGKVLFVAHDRQKVLSIKDDPLGLPGFFPQAKPVQPITGTGKTTPVCPYAVYRKLAEELNTATKRINAIMKGLKVRGIIAGDASVAEVVADLGDNELAPVANIENLAATGGLEKAVMWWPIDTSIQVLRELYAQREQTKQAIYEITGISDIIRGQGQASETATAQNIKTQWGALRIKKMQRLIERQVRELFVLAAEIMSRHFSMETLQVASGVQITPEMQRLLERPMDHYRIDVESDSTVRADLVKGRQEMSEFLQGTAQYFSTMAPIMAQAPQAAGPAVEIYSAFARQFSLGKSAEDALDQFVEMAKQAADQPQPNPEAEAQKAEMELRAKELEIRAQEAQGKQSLEVQKLQLQAQNLGLDGQLKQADLMLKNRDLGIKADQQAVNEAKAEVDAAAKILEIEMEEDQQRAVKFGTED